MNQRERRETNKRRREEKKKIQKQYEPKLIFNCTSFPLQS